MSKSFYLLLPRTNERVTISVDDADAWRLRSEMWRVKKLKNGFHVYKKLHGSEEGLGRAILGIKEDDVWASHKNGDSTDYRKANLIRMERSVGLKIQRMIMGHDWSTGYCKRGHKMTPENRMSNGDGITCRACATDRKRNDYYAKKAAA